MPKKKETKIEIVEDKEKSFLEVLNLIQEAKEQTFNAINTGVITLYWNIGEYISNKVKKASWGMGVVSELADYIQNKIPNQKGFSDKNIWRMKQFFETYHGNKKLMELLNKVSWSNHLHILGKTKTMEEKEFYLKLSIRERYTKREIERQIDSGYFERYMLSEPKLSPVVRELGNDKQKHFKDLYALDFLDLPKDYSEFDFQKSIIKNLKDFVLEFGKDFAFIGEEYRVQVGNSDFFIDLLFYHRDLQCLVAFELKIEAFKPEFLGKLNFYLEALDRDIKKPHENPSVGIILCPTKDNAVVEYSLSRNMSPALIAEYQTKLIDKKILQDKLNNMIQIREDMQNE